MAANPSSGHALTANHSRQPPLSTIAKVSEFGMSLTGHYCPDCYIGGDTYEVTAVVKLRSCLEREHLRLGRKRRKRN